MPEIGNKIERADIDLIDETFDISQSENYHLSIQTGQDRLTFCVLNTVIKKYIVLRSYRLSKIDISLSATIVNACRAIFEKDDLLGLRYKSSSFLWVSPRSTLVPEEFFRHNAATDYLAFNHGTAADEHALQNHIKSAKLHNIFSYPKALISLLQLYRPNIKLFHHATTIIENIVADSKNNMAVHFYTDHIDVIAVKNGNLQYYNTFRINAVDDAVYYFTLVANMLKTDMQSIKLVVLGKSNEAFDGFVGRVVESEPLDAITYSHYISEQYRKEYINLFNLYGCV